MSINTRLYQMGEYYSVMKRKNPDPCGQPWGAMLRFTSWSPKDKYCLIRLIWEAESRFLNRRNKTAGRSLSPTQAYGV